MHCTTAILFLASILPFLSVLAVTTQKIVSTNQVLEQSANRNDKDVSGLNAVNVALRAQVIVLFKYLSTFHEKTPPEKWANIEYTETSLSAKLTITTENQQRTRRFSL